MAAYGGWAISQRDTAVVERKREEQTYGTAVGLALEYSLRNLNGDQIRTTINQISREPSVFGVLVYDSTGQILYRSNSMEGADAAPLPSLRPVLRDGQIINIERQMDDDEAYSVIRPLRDAQNRLIGALEIAQPLGIVDDEEAQTWTSILLNTLTLLVAVTLITWGLVRYFVLHPLSQLVSGARALSRGELGFRIAEDRDAGELTEVAREFNSMAARLEQARSDILHEAEARVDLERRLQDAEKLAGVGRVAAGLAHEVAAPLNVISGRAEMMLREDMPAESRQRNLRIIVDQISRITAVIRSRLDFARRRDPRIGPVEIVATIEKAAESLGADFAARSIEFTMDGAPEAWVQGDDQLLHQALTNLILNAVHSLETVTDRPRTIRARVEILDAAPEFSEGRVVIEIQDNGPGIPEDILPRVFDPFFTTKPRGMGLGLALTRGIVADHGGSIQVVGGDGTALGARFRIELDAVARPVPAHV
jgi:signal transduction histidine kinase